MLQALKDNVIVRPIYEERKGNIIIPEGAKVFKQYHGFVVGEVVSVGKRYPYPLKAGDRVLWRRHEGKKVFEDGKLYFVLKERWVEAVYHEDTKHKQAAELLRKGCFIG